MTLNFMLWDRVELTADFPRGKFSIKWGKSTRGSELAQICCDIAVGQEQGRANARERI